MQTGYESSISLEDNSYLSDILSEEIELLKEKINASPIVISTNKAVEGHDSTHIRVVIEKQQKIVQDNQFSPVQYFRQGKYHHLPEFQIQQGRIY